MPLVEADIFHHVEAHRIIGVERREVDDVFDPLVRDEIQELLRGRTVRIDEGDPFAVLDILNRHILEHGRFTHPGLADHVDVFAAIDRADAKHVALAARVRRREIRDPAIIVTMIRVHIFSIPQTRFYSRRAYRLPFCRIAV